MRPLSIGLFTDVYLPDPNGVSTSVLLLQRELRRRGHDAWIVAPAFPKYERDEPGVLRVRSVPNPALKHQRLAVPGRHRLPDTFDLVHSHAPWVIGWWGARIARRWGVPHVSTFHTHLERYTHYVPGLSKLDRHTRAVARLARRFYNAADLVVAPSNATRRVVEGYGVERPIRVIPTGIDEALLSGAPERPSPWPPGTRRVLTIGRLGHEKRVDLALAALAELRRAHDAHLVVIGQGPQEGHLRELAARLGVGEAVTFLGTVPLGEIGAYYRQAELFVFASDTETQGLVLHEAQTMGVPVVAVGAEGTLDAVRHGESGFLVEPGDVAGLARRSGALLGDPVRLAAFAAQARVVGQTWSAAAISRQMLDAYEELLDCPRSPSPGLTVRASSARLRLARRSTLTFGPRGS